MKRLLLTVAAATLVAAAGAAPEKKAAAPAAPATANAASGSISFSSDIAPLLRQRCATCHLTGKEAGHLALHPKAAHASLVNQPSEGSEHPLVVPGKPEQSYLVMKLRGTHLDHGGTGSRMPFGAPPLAAKDVDKIAAWVKAGAPDN